MAKRSAARGQAELMDYLHAVTAPKAEEDAAHIAELHTLLQRALTCIESFCLASDWLEGGEDTEGVHDQAHLARNPSGIIAEIEAALADQ